MRADHQRDDVVADPNPEWHNRQEDHGGAVHGEYLVVQVGIQDGPIRLSKLEPDQHGLNPADEEENERSYGIENADLFMIDSQNPIEKATFEDWPVI